MVKVPKTRRTFCKGTLCRKHTLHKITQYKRSKERRTCQGRRRYKIKQQGNGGQKRPIFHKKSKLTKKIVLRMQCNECQHKHHITLKRAKCFELTNEKKPRDEVGQW
jgi:large subunit ribosomal protein L44e